MHVDISLVYMQPPAAVGSHEEHCGSIEHGLFIIESFQPACQTLSLHQNQPD